MPEMLLQQQDGLVDRMLSSFSRIGIRMTFTLSPHSDHRHSSLAESTYSLSSFTMLPPMSIL
jgi:hypothetical protein